MRYYSLFAIAALVSSALATPIDSEKRQGGGASGFYETIENGVVVKHYWTTAFGSAPTPSAQKQQNAAKTVTVIAGQTQAPTTSVPTPTPSASNSNSNNDNNSSAPASGSYQDRMLQAHAVHRANHSADALIWDASLADSAQQVAQTCNFSHQMDVGGINYGQNLAAGSGIDEAHGEKSMNMWYNGEINAYMPFFDKEGGAPLEQTGHFTQVVWKGTKQLGCATVPCSSGTAAPYFTVCNYLPRGNVGSQYLANVGKPLGKATVVS